MLQSQLAVGIFPFEPVITAGIVWGVYKLFLSTHTKPRHALIFLLAGAFLSFLTLFLELRTPNSAFPLLTGELYMRPFEFGVRESIYAPLNRLHESLSDHLGFPAVYLSILVVMVAAIVWELGRLRRFKQCSNGGTERKGYRLFHSTNPEAFSFADNVFLPHDLKEYQHRFVLRHELGHVRNYHFAQLIFLRALLCLQWYNPFLWLIVREVKLIHEYEADRYALRYSPGESKEYQLCLVEMTTGCPQRLSLENHFADSSLKKRILKMNKKEHNRRSSLLLFSFLPVMVAVAGLIIGSRPTESIYQKKDAHPLQGFYQLVDARAIAYKNGIQTEEYNQKTAYYYKVIGTKSMAILLFPNGLQPKEENCANRTSDFEYVSSTEIREAGKTLPISILDKNRFTLQYTKHFFNPEVDSLVVTELWEEREVPDYCRKWVKDIL